MKWLILFVLPLFVPLCTLAQTRPAPTTAPEHVTFRDDGITLVNGKPFFPIGIWVYHLNTDVMADLHEHLFNTIVGNGFGPDKLDFIYNHGMMCMPIVSDEWVATGINHPALLAWCLIDEPEGKQTPEQCKKSYEALKAKDPNHPIGIDHYLYNALPQYAGCDDFTMTDVYPIMHDRDGIITNVGKFIDHAREAEKNPNWPHWVYIQDFGGATDGGKSAQPLPHEVRCMTFIALVHRAGGILYFSYWPQAPTTWNSITDLNHDLLGIEPWILARGQEIPATSQDPGIQVRARKIGSSWIVMAVNCQPKFKDMKIHVDGLPDSPLREAFANRQLKSTDGDIHDRLPPYGVAVYLLGNEPKVD